MQQEFLMLADGAEAVGGKIYVLGGGVERYTAAQFPVRLKADVACGVLVGWGEANRTFAVALKIVSEDEEVVVAMDFTMEVGRPPGAKAAQDLRTLMAVKGPFPIPKAGAYKLVMEIAGKVQEPPFRFWVDPIEGRATKK